MNKKNLLLGVVIIIWSFVSIRFFYSFNKTEEFSIPNTTSTIVSNLQPENNPIKSISSFERDPFLGTINKKKVLKKPVIKNTVRWPNIIYLGNIKNLDNGSELYFIQLEGRLILWKLNESYSDIELVRGMQDKITLRYQGVQKSILKNGI